MAFPVVESTATSIESSEVTSHTVTMPSGIVSGDTLVVIAGLDERQISSAGTGWTQVDQDFHDDNTTPINLSTVLLTRTADGTEGATQEAFTTGNPCESAHIAFRISGSDGTVENAGDASSVSPGASPDPPSHTPSGGAADYLWLAVGLTDFGSATWQSAPTNYTNMLTATTGTSTADANIAVARRNLNASSEDPGTFDLSSAQNWMAWTISVAPEAATPVSKTTTLQAHHLAEISQVETLHAHHMLSASLPLTIHAYHKAEIAAAGPGRGSQRIGLDLGMGI